LNLPERSQEVRPNLLGNRDHSENHWSDVSREISGRMSFVSHPMMVIKGIAESIMPSAVIRSVPISQCHRAKPTVPSGFRHFERAAEHAHPSSSKHALEVISLDRDSARPSSSVDVRRAELTMDHTRLPVDRKPEAFSAVNGQE
jgi:hypothetical protein